MVRPTQAPTSRAELHVARHATEIDDHGERHSRALPAWRTCDAYVLLGDPGAGKTWAMRSECEAVGGLWIDARNVVAGVVRDVPGERIVFIDGLDEVRSGVTDHKAPFDAIRRWLLDHGQPRFRLSCREADWLANDRMRLEEVARGGAIAVLHLDPLRDEDIDAILSSWRDEVQDIDAFRTWVSNAGLTELLRNPLLLQLLVASRQSGDAPRTRSGVYDAAVRQLAQEHNEEHPHANASVVLKDAAALCAVLLLSGRRGVAPPRGRRSGDVVVLDHLEALPLADPTKALASKLFRDDAGARTPRHRTVAEYLAGWDLARRIDDGLPLGRVMALMQGIDGAPVEALRGLWAWLAVHHAAGRDVLIEADPFGFVLNGDAARLTTQQLEGLLKALHRATEKDPWLRRQSWVSHPLGWMVRRDLAECYEVLLRDPRRDTGHLAFIDLLLAALQHGEPIASLDAILRRWVEDGANPSRLRTAAYAAWVHCTGGDSRQALTWLEAIAGGALPDSDDELTGTLLDDLYPEHLSPERIFDHWHLPRQRDLYGAYKAFWNTALWQRTPEDRFDTLVEAWLNRPSHESGRHPSERDYDALAFPGRLLAAALAHRGDEVCDATLYRWLGLGLDEHGFARREAHQEGVQQWLSARPDRMKAVYRLGLCDLQPDDRGRRHFWTVDQRLHGAERPRDWYCWLLEVAAETAIESVAEHCFSQSAHAALSPSAWHDGPSMEAVEAWVSRHAVCWPQAKNWLESAWSMDLSHWQGEELRRTRQASGERHVREEERRRHLAPYIPSLLDGTAPPGLLQQVAIAHEHGFSDVSGQTPLERVANLLVCEESTAAAVIDALPRVLQRSDLPTADEAIQEDARGRYHHLRPAALLAAKLQFARDSAAVLTWPASLAERLVAYYLTDGTGEMPGWYRELVRQRPAWVAPVLLRYARPKLRRRGEPNVNGLWALDHEADHAALARLVLPDLLEAVPRKASEPVRRILNRSLLPALALLDRADAAALVRARLAGQAMDAAQQIAWLVADLPFRSEAAQALAALVGRNERRAVELGTALHHQRTLSRVNHVLGPQALQHLIEVLGPVTSPDAWLKGGWVTAAHERSGTVRALFAALANQPNVQAEAALRALHRDPALGRWADQAHYYLSVQSQAAREAGFKVLSPAEVITALTGGAPANPADLRSLVEDHLCELVHLWRGMDTFVLQHFWRDDGKTPRVENECRDVLLHDLRPRLARLDVALTPERSAARGKRADLCAELLRDGHRMALPIELKKQNHEDLWTAWRDQLDRLYTVDPDGGGLGLYIVLWFGVLQGKEKLATHPEGWRVDSAEALRAAIENRIPITDRHRIAVMVLDLSLPE